MRIALNPIMVGLIAAALPALPTALLAAERAPIVIDDPTGHTQVTLDDGDTITSNGWPISAAIQVSGDGNAVHGNGITATITGSHKPLEGNAGVRAQDGGLITLSNSVINTVGSGIETRGVLATGANSRVILRDSQITTKSDGAFSIKAEAGGHVNIDGGSVETLGFNTIAMFAYQAGSAITANDVAIFAHDGAGVIANEGSEITLTGGSVQTTGRSTAISVQDAVVTANNVAITATVGSGVRADQGGTATLTGGSVDVAGNGAFGLIANDLGATLVATNLDVRSAADAAGGVRINDRASVTLDNTRIYAQGTATDGISSVLQQSGQTNTVTVRNGSLVDTRNGTGLLALGGNHTFIVSDSTITARTSAAADTGILLDANYNDISSSGLGTLLNAEHITLDATHSLLTGDVLANDGAVDVSLKRGSVLTGALVQRATGKINRLDLDASSTWNVRNDSTLATLNNAGTVAFVAPSGATGFKTLTVNNYVGGGTLVLNTQLGNDASATDKLVIDGGAATGNTALRVINAGGTGGNTATGIRLVQTLNGGTTAPDAFHLDAGSTGYRASSSTLALNGYEYSLVRGGNGGAAPDWYLTSGNSGTAPLPDPALHIGPLIPVGPPAKPAWRNVSPESGAYLGNRLASAQFFTHGLHDRTPSSGSGDTAALAQRDGGGDAATGDTPSVNTGRGVWTRVVGRQDSGLRMAQGRVNIDADSAILQLGGDLMKAPLGQGGAVYAGLMGGYGDARTTATSTLMLPGGQSVQARARGKVSGYSVGVYGTVYQNDVTRLGAYADTWLQYGRYSNQINSEVGSARYHSTAWSASVEAGYAVKPFANTSVLAPLVIEPHAQFVYSRYAAQDASLQGTRMRSSNDNALTSRIGARVYPQATANAPAVRPFLEANWLHSFGNPSVQMGANTLDAALSRNSLELKLGAEGRVSRAVQISGHVFGQAGNNHQRGYGGMLNVGYRW